MKKKGGRARGSSVNGGGKERADKDGGNLYPERCEEAKTEKQSAAANERLDTPPRGRLDQEKT